MLLIGLKIRGWRLTYVCSDSQSKRAEHDGTHNVDYVDINPSARTSLVLVHGWPSLWSSWSNQILEFQVWSFSPVSRFLTFHSEWISHNRSGQSRIRKFYASRRCTVFRNNARYRRRSGLRSSSCRRAKRNLYRVKLIRSPSSDFTYSRLYGSHDWGAQVCWEAARQRPDIFNAVSGIVVPVSTRFPFLTWYNMNRLTSPVYAICRQFCTNK